MPKIIKKAFAKLDLGIHIEPIKSKDGLFPVSYIDCQLDICDELTLKKKKDGIEIICDDRDVPTDDKNFVYQAALLLRESSGKKDLGAKIELKKKIPVKAGFGGGSSDGAAAVLGLSKLWNISLSQNQLSQFSKKLGKDFYFSLSGGLSKITSVGRDYQIQPLSSDMLFWVVVVEPLDEKPSTGWIYEHLNLKLVGSNLDRLNKLEQALLKGDRNDFVANLWNDFEDSVSAYFPVVSKAKQDLADLGASGKIMAGAGLSVVGFFDSIKSAESASKILRKNPNYKEVLVSKTIF